MDGSLKQLNCELDFFDSLFPLDSLDSLEVIEKFDTNLATIARATSSVCDKLKSNEIFGRVFINRNGIRHFLRLLEILSKINYFPTLANISANVGNSFQNNWPHFSIMEHNILSTICHLADKWKIVADTFDDHCLAIIFAFLDSSDIITRVIVLKIFIKVANLWPDTLLDMIQNHGRYDGVQNLIDQFNFDTDLSLDGVKYHVLYLFVQILNNGPAERLLQLRHDIQQGLQMPTGAPPDSWVGLLEQYRTANDRLDAPRISSEAAQLDAKVAKLKQAFNELQIEKNNLLHVERELRDRCDKLLKSFSKLKCDKSWMANKPSIDSGIAKATVFTDYGVHSSLFTLNNNGNSHYGSVNKKQSAEAADNLIVDFNVKSSEEEIVYSTLPAHRAAITATKPTRLSLLCRGGNKASNSAGSELYSQEKRSSPANGGYITAPTQNVSKNPLYETVAGGRLGDSLEDDWNAGHWNNRFANEALQISAFESNFILRKSNQHGDEWAVDNGLFSEHCHPRPSSALDNSLVETIVDFSHA